MTIYTHILIPIDGSKLSLKAVKETAALARACKAKVTMLYVIEPFMPHVDDESFARLTLTRDQAVYKRFAEKAASEALAKAGKGLVAAKLKFTTEFVVAERPWQGILETARKRKCDLIVMASHGRGGLAGVVLGSETHKVLAHSKIPVLVCR